MKEAVYDGRYLRIAHATRDKSATKPFDKKTEEDVWNGNFELRAATMDEVSWASMDYAFVNGHNLNPSGAPGWFIGPGNGETIAWIQYDMSEIEAGDKLEVVLAHQGQAQH